MSNNDLSREQRSIEAEKWMQKALYDGNYTEIYRDFFKYFDKKIQKNQNTLVNLK